MSVCDVTVTVGKVALSPDEIVDAFIAGERGPWFCNDDTVTDEMMEHMMDGAMQGEIVPGSVIVKVGK